MDITMMAVAVTTEVGVTKAANIMAGVMRVGIAAGVMVSMVTMKAITS
jgi:hypothetical protein